MTPRARFASLAATWPAAATRDFRPVRLRDGAGDGSRVSAATLEGPWQPTTITAAETTMRAEEQMPLFMLRALELAALAQRRGTGRALMAMAAGWTRDAGTPGRRDAGPRLGGDPCQRPAPRPLCRSRLCRAYRLSLPSRRSMRRLLPFALLWPGLATAQLPELPLPDGAVRTVEILRETDAYALPTGPADDAPPPATQLQGDVRLGAWRIPDAPDPARILAPIRTALERAGFEVLLDCATERCGGFDFRYGTEVLPPPEMYVDLGAFRALSARRDGPEGVVAVSALASRAGPSTFLQLVTVTPGGEAASVIAPTAEPSASPVPDDLASALMRDGHAALNGIDFAPGSVELHAAESLSLDALVTWLAADPSRRLVLVGHTDMTGPLDANIALSRRRAEAVRQRLLEAGIAPGRLEAHGVGWLAPRAPNATAEGRAANRRVEAVVPGN